MKKEEFTKRFTYNATTDLLGSGGFGKVFKAWDNDAECYVAIKMQSVDPRYPGLRLSEEVEKAARLRHPNVARYKECYTFSTMDGTKDIAVMSYYEDGSLDKLLASGKLGREDIFSLLTEILEGIAYLHSEGIIHRDLKPQNVLILHHGGALYAEDYRLRYLEAVGRRAELGREQLGAWRYTLVRLARTA